MIPRTLSRFIELFSKIPGIGPRQAHRIAFWFLKHDRNFIYSYAVCIRDLADKIRVCSQCFFVFEAAPNDSQALCAICRDAARDQTRIAVLEKETDLLSIEKTKKYNGLYHVLGGLFSPIEGNNHDLKIQQLVQRLRANPQTQEIILGFSHTAEGDLTAMEMERILKSFPAKVTRLGLGLPRGGDVEFADEDTLGNALQSRR